MSAANARRVAIVGVGPKGLYGLERLAYHASVCQRPLEVELFEPTGEPGAGAIYRSGQPDYLRMNFADELINAWADGPAAVPARERLSLIDWMRREGVSSEGYSPRSLVGSYLRACFDAVRSALPPSVRLRVHREPVRALERSRRGWIVRAQMTVVDCDEVLLATGHRGRRVGEGTILPISYPIGDSLGPDAIAPGARVTARGMALTLIDAALDLTEGRGGRFEAKAKGGLRYIGSAADVGTLTATSRSGRAMAVKPHPRANDPVREALAHEGNRALESLDPFTVPAIEHQLAQSAAAILLAERGRDPEPDRVVSLGRAIRRRFSRRISDLDGGRPSPQAELKRSLGAAQGERRVNGGWALGEAWRALYPAIVARGSYGGIPDGQWQRFAALAREMERTAFGPPPVNGAKLVALLEAGKVVLGPPRPAAGPADADPPCAEVSLNAVLPAPGAAENSGDLTDSLLAGGYIRRAAGGRRGIEVRADRSCIGADGTPTRGLAAIGRVTEDWIIGNDTLSRRFPSQSPDGWAKRVIAR